MTDTQAAGDVPGLSGTELEAALTAAKAEGERAALARINGVIRTAGIKGDAARTAAAIDLLARAPAMSGADVADWIVRCIPATPTADAVPDYVVRRASMHVVARSHPVASTTDSDDRPATNEPRDGNAGDVPPPSR